MLRGIAEVIAPQAFLKEPMCLPRGFRRCASQPRKASRLGRDAGAISLGAMEWMSSLATHAHRIDFDSH
jgi:hypothetical protein